MSIQSVQNTSVNPLAANLNNNSEKMTDSLGKEYKFADVTADSLKKNKLKKRQRRPKKQKEQDMTRTHL